ncbi:MAG: prepilin-type N-terminal cleavage/methylation domain-containing protein [Gemmataceae bacterium]
MIARRTVGKRRKRFAFTLLEMTLSLSIGLVILGALYFLLSGQINLTQKGRDVLEEGTVVRAVFTKMISDAQGTLGPVDVRIVPDYSTPYSDPSAATDSSSGTATGSASATKSSSSSSSSGTTSDPSNVAYFNVGVQGGQDYLILTIGRAVRPGNPDLNEAAGLRRILYWMVPGDKGGLARKEIKNATGAEMSVTPDTVDSPETCVIAPEVISVAFEYFDGSSFNSTWDGANPVGDISQPTGPPSAIRVTLTLRKRGAPAGSMSADDTVQYQQVIAIPTGNAFTQEGS